MTTTVQLEKRVQRLERAIKQLTITVDLDTIATSEDTAAVTTLRRAEKAGTLVDWKDLQRQLDAR